MRLASTQFGLFSREQAEDHGFTADAIKWKLRRQYWERVRWGVFRVFGMHSTWSQTARGVLLQAGDDAALSHGTAAFLYGLDGFKKGSPRVFDLTSPRRLEWADSTVRLHLNEAVAMPTETVRGLTVTSLARTVHDLTGVLKAEPLEQAFDSARRTRQLFPTQLDEYLATLGQEDLGSNMLRQVIAERASPLDSAPEVILYREALKRGLPKPVPGYSVYDDGKFIAKVDIGWKDQKVAAMFDSYLHHSARTAFDKDARQRAKLQLAGWTIVGVTKRMLAESVWSDTLKALLAGAQRK